MWKTVTINDAIVGMSFFCLFYLLLKNRINSIFDPIILWGWLICLSFALVVTDAISGTDNKFNSILLISVFFSALLASRIIDFLGPRRFGKKDLRKESCIKDGYLKLLSFLCFVLLLAVFVNNYIFGYSPLLSGGYDSRFETSNNNRLLEYIYLGVSAIPIPLAVIGSKKVRRYAFLSIIIIILIAVFRANKSSVLTPVIMATQYFFIRQLVTGVSVSRKVLVSIIFIVFIVFLLFPYYLSIVIPGLDANGAYQLIIGRLFLTLDGLVVASSANYHLFNESMSFWELIFSPFYKILGVNSNPYNSASDYLIYLETGLVPGTYNGPMDNIFVELLVTNSEVIISCIILFFYTLFIFNLRSIYITKKCFNVFSLFIYCSLILKPLFFLTHGYLFIISSIMTFVIIYGCYVIYLLLNRFTHG